MSYIKVSLHYLEERKLHPTRGARFAASHRLRLTNSYNVAGQIAASVMLIIWSIVPLAVEVPSPKAFALLGTAASIAILALTLHQQAGTYVDASRLLEASARAIDRLRNEVAADIAAGLAEDSDRYRERSAQYANVLDENPVNHTELDVVVSRAQSSGQFGRVRAMLILHFRAGIGFWLCVAMVLLPATIIFCNG